MPTIFRVYILMRKTAGYLLTIRQAYAAAAESMAEDGQKRAG